MHMALMKNESRQQDVDPLLTPQEVADWLRVSPAWVRDHATRRKPLLPTVKLGQGKGAPLRFHPEKIREFIEKWTK
jgi:Helix-turn-helix domain